MACKILVVVWKDLLMRRNHWIVTILEIVLPLSLLICTNIAITQPMIPEHTVEKLTTFEDYNCKVTKGHFYKVTYWPANDFYDKLMEKVACFAGYKKTSVKPSLANATDIEFDIGIEFEGNSSASLRYTLYPTDNMWVNLQNTWRFSGRALPSYTSPLMFDILELKHAIDTVYLQMMDVAVPKISLTNSDVFTKQPNFLEGILTWVLFFSFCFLVPVIVSRIVQEKETGAKELMILTGLRRCELWLAKLLDSMLVLTVVVTCIVLLLYVPLTADSIVLHHVQPWIMWGVLMFGVFNFVLFLFFMSCWFNSSTVAVWTTQVLWGLSYLIGTGVLQAANLGMLSVARHYRLLFCLLPHVCLVTAFGILMEFDFYEKRVRLSEQLSASEDVLTLLDTLLMMALDALLYSLLTWYLDHVRPGKFGVPQSYLFFLSKTYWKPNQVSTAEKSALPDGEEPLKDMEPVSGDMKVGVCVRHLFKKYSGLGRGHVVAVDDVSINFHQGEITALLGHNGAGKTTTMSIITGMIPPTAGQVFINGYDISCNADLARSSLGLCPQQDMLFRDMTPMQIIVFFARLKGLSNRDAVKEAEKLMQTLRLTDARNTKSQDLSGGQKRKVSLAIALVGGSKVVILDEPTSGMDPEIRRDIWEILLGLRGERTVVLTTHFMEEADAVSDRIAIMDHGKVKCYGSPLYLKSKFGTGYTLSCVLTAARCRDEAAELIKACIPVARYKAMNGLTLSYQIPDTDTALFPQLFQRLDSAKEEVASYSIAITTLEDVFLRVGGSEDKKGKACVDEVDGSSPYKRFSSTEALDLKRLKGPMLFLTQAYALLVKKCIHLARNIVSFSCFVIVPMLLILTSLCLLPYLTTQAQNNHPTVTHSKAVSLDLHLYRNSEVLYSADENSLPVAREFALLVRLSGSLARMVPNITQETQTIFQTDMKRYLRSLVMTANFTKGEILVGHNSQAVHVAPAALTMLANSLLRAAGRTETISTTVDASHAHRASLLTRPVTEAQSCNIGDIPDTTGIQTLFYMLGPLQESIYGAKALQLMLAPTALYWFTHLIFDVVTFVCYLMVVVFVYSGSDGGDFVYEHIGHVLVSLTMWGVGMILVSYLVGCLVRRKGAAAVVFMLVYIVFSYLVYTAVELEVLPRFFLYLHPTTIIKDGFSHYCAQEQDNALVYLLLYDTALFLLLVLIDSSFLERLIHATITKCLHVDYSTDKTSGADEPDSAVEREECLATGPSSNEKALLVQDLRRWYGWWPSSRKPAVRGVSFTVAPGECFGLLGVNGAGKSSTFNMLTGVLPVSQGEAFVNNIRLNSCTTRSKYLFQIGYCPQNAGIIPEFQGKELLQLLARLRGVHRSIVVSEVKKWVTVLDLLEHESKQCGRYSGGNQRKLQTALALIGDSSLVFLDEPTSGVDPVARRCIWDVITVARTEGQSIVLTSHSMDECEALCSRLAIMVNGRFRCLGETVTLKNTYGQGYSVQVKISGTASPMDADQIKEKMVAMFGSGCHLTDEHLTILQYHITDKHISWSKLFSSMENLKRSFSSVESYTASATTLEQIFMYFARSNL